MKKSYLAGAFFLLLLTSCGSLRVNTAKSLDIQTSVKSYSLADLQISSTRVSGKAIRTKGETIEQLKLMAVANALEVNGGDVLVEPQYTITQRGSRVTVSVTGYSGKYTNFRPGKIECNICK